MADRATEGQGRAATRERVAFGPAYFCLLIIVVYATFVAFAEARSDPDPRYFIFLPGLWWLCAFAGAAVNVPRWRRFGVFELICLVLLCAIAVSPFLLSALMFVG